MSLRDHLVDVGPLRKNRPFRAFWAGSAISTLGSQMAAFALTYYVWRVSQSAVVLGSSAWSRACRWWSSRRWADTSPTP